MTGGGGYGEPSSDDYQAKPGYGEFPALPADGYGVSSGKEETSSGISSSVPPGEQYPAIPPASYEPPNPYLPPQYGTQAAGSQQYQQPLPNYQAPPQYQTPPFPHGPQYQQYQPYGSPPPYTQPYQYGSGYAGQPPPGTNGLAIASLITSVLGICLYGIGAVIGIILGIVALSQIKKSGQEGRGLAISGIVVGGLVIVGYVGFILFVINSEYPPY